MKMDCTIQNSCILIGENLYKCIHSAQARSQAHPLASRSNLQVGNRHRRKAKALAVEDSNHERRRFIFLNLTRTRVVHELRMVEHVR